MPWFDGHCDVLYKLWKGEATKAAFQSGEKVLDVTVPGLYEGEVDIQVFAIYIPPTVPRHHTWYVCLQQIDLFYHIVVGKEGPLSFITKGEDLQEDHKRKMPKALLALEGADALQGEITYLRTLQRLGVRQIGLTWNYANEVADGILEERKGGVTRFGKQLLAEMSRLQMIVDVSHLSLAGFWDVMDQQPIPVVASHSNAKSICPHPRNLDDRQILALIRQQGLMGITFVPAFIHQQADQARVDHLLAHIDHVCALGGENILTFGSDFDGFTHKISGLENTKDFVQLKETLIKYFPTRLVARWARGNAQAFYQRHLPNN